MCCDTYQDKYVCYIPVLFAVRDGCILIRSYANMCVRIISRMMPYFYHILLFTSFCKDVQRTIFPDKYIRGLRSVLLWIGAQQQPTDASFLLNLMVLVVLVKTNSVQYFSISIYMVYTLVCYGLVRNTSRLIMMTSSNGNIFRVTGPLCGEFTGPGEFPTQRPVTRSFDVFFDRRLNKRLCKQPRGWWLETLSCSLWRQSDDRISIKLNVFLRFCKYVQRTIFSDK